VLRIGRTLSSANTTPRWFLHFACLGKRGPYAALFRTKLRSRLHLPSSLRYFSGNALVSLPFSSQKDGRHAVAYHTRGPSSASASRYEAGICDPLRRWSGRRTIRIGVHAPNILQWLATSCSSPVLDWIIYTLGSWLHAKMKRPCRAFDIPAQCWGPNTRRVSTRQSRENCMNADTRLTLARS
jgi:hypothetical protein